MKMTYAKRQKLPKSSFALPTGTKARKAAGGGGSFPVTDMAHGRNALSRAHQKPNGPGSAADRAVHAKVKARYPALYKAHMANAH